MKDKTIVDWIEQQMMEGNLSLKEILEQAKEIEKEQSDKPLDEKVFNLANEFAVAGYGDIAVRLHSIHNEFLKYRDEQTYGGNK